MGPRWLHVYTLDECQGSSKKTKRDFEVGDYIVGDVGVCEKWQGRKMIVSIYGEKVAKC